MGCEARMALLDLSQILEWPLITLLVADNEVDQGVWFIFISQELTL